MAFILSLIVGICETDPGPARCPGESERSDLSGVGAKRPPLVSKYPENSDLFSLLVANCLCLLFLHKSELKLKLSVGWTSQVVVLFVGELVYTGLHWLHVHGAACYWTLAPDAGSAQCCTRDSISGPNDTFYVLITDELNWSSPAEGAASCAHVHALGSSWTTRSGLLSREPGSHAGRGCGITLAGRGIQSGKPIFTAVDLPVPRLNPPTLKNTPRLVFSFILYQREAVVPGSSQGRPDPPHVVFLLISRTAKSGNFTNRKEDTRKSHNYVQRYRISSVFTCKT